MKADETQIQQVPDVGPVVAAEVAAFFASADHINVIKELREKGVTWPDMPASAAAAQLRSPGARSSSPARSRA